MASKRDFRHLATAHRIQSNPLTLNRGTALGVRAARDIGFLDEVFDEDARSFEAEIRDRARLLAANPEFRALLRRKHEGRMEDEGIKPLANYRTEELERMKVNFFRAGPSYHEARRRFVFKGTMAYPAMTAMIE